MSLARRVDQIAELFPDVDKLTIQDLLMELRTDEEVIDRILRGDFHSFKSKTKTPTPKQQPVQQEATQQQPVQETKQFNHYQNREQRNFNQRPRGNRQQRQFNQQRQAPKQENTEYIGNTWGSLDPDFAASTTPEQPQENHSRQMAQPKTEVQKEVENTNTFSQKPVNQRYQNKKEEPQPVPAPAVEKAEPVLKQKSRPQLQQPPMPPQLQKQSVSPPQPQVVQNPYQNAFGSVVNGPPPGFQQYSQPDQIITPDVAPQQHKSQSSAPVLLLPVEIASIPVEYNIFGYFAGPIMPMPMQFPATIPPGM